MQVSLAVDSITVQPALRPGPLGAEKATDNLELLAQVMRDIQDAAEHRSETYVGLYRLQPKNDVFTPYHAPGKNFVTDDSTLHEYLLEVQISPREKIDATRTWVNNLFPTNKLEEDGTHRVLRASSSISVGQAAMHWEATVALSAPSETPAMRHAYRVLILLEERILHLTLKNNQIECK